MGPKLKLMNIRAEVSCATPTTCVLLFDVSLCRTMAETSVEEGLPADATDPQADGCEKAPKRSKGPKDTRRKKRRRKKPRSSGGSADALARRLNKLSQEEWVDLMDQLVQQEREEEVGLMTQLISDAAAEVRCCVCLCLRTQFSKLRALHLAGRWKRCRAPNVERVCTGLDGFICLRRSLWPKCCEADSTSGNHDASTQDYLG